MAKVLLFLALTIAWSSLAAPWTITTHNSRMALSCHFENMDSQALLQSVQYFNQFGTIRRVLYFSNKSSEIVDVKNSTAAAEWQYLISIDPSIPPEILDLLAKILI